MSGCLVEKKEGFSQAGIYQGHDGEEVIPLSGGVSHSMLDFRLRVLEIVEDLTQYPALESFRDRRRRKTKMLVRHMIATQVPMIRPR